LELSLVLRLTQIRVGQRLNLGDWLGVWGIASYPDWNFLLVEPSVGV
jgi:hypothetical protein